MSINLSKGGNINLSKEDPGLEDVLVGLGWAPRTTPGVEFDLDASAFILDATGKVRSDADFIFYKNKLAADGSVEHMGDNRNGVGDGDDEQIKIHLLKLASGVTRVVITCTIYEGLARAQNFGMVSDAYIRIVNAKTGKEITRYDLSEDASLNRAMVFGEIYRYENSWKFRAIGEGFLGGLAKLCDNYGIDAKSE